MEEAAQESCFSPEQGEQGRQGQTLGFLPFILDAGGGCLEVSSCA